MDPNADSPAKCTSFSANMTSVVLKADILSSDVQTQSKVSNISEFLAATIIIGTVPGQFLASLYIHTYPLYVHSSPNERP